MNNPSKISYIHRGDVEVSAREVVRMTELIEAEEFDVANRMREDILLRVRTLKRLVGSEVKKGGKGSDGTGSETYLVLLDMESDLNRIGEVLTPKLPPRVVLTVVPSAQPDQ